MKTNSELKIAAVVGAIMIIICLVVILMNNTSNEEISLKVLINKEIDGQRGYLECSVPESILGEINTEFKKAIKLDSSQIAQRHQIQGKYKVMSDKASIAFDNDEDNEVYVIEDKQLYNFKSTIYDLVISVCE